MLEKVWHKFYNSTNNEQCAMRLNKMIQIELRLLLDVNRVETRQCWSLPKKIESNAQAAGSPTISFMDSIKPHGKYTKYKSHQFII